MRRFLAILALLGCPAALGATAIATNATDSDKLGGITPAQWASSA